MGWKDAPLVDAPPAWSMAPEVSADAKASLFDKVIGSGPGSLALGVSDLVTGPLVLGANVGSKLMEKLDPETAKRFNLGEFANEKMAELNAASERGRAYHGNRKGFDAIRMLGGVGTGLLGLGKYGINLPVAKSYLGKVLGGGVLGGTFGATSAPTSSEPQSVDAYLDEQETKGKIGAAVGFGIPAFVAPLAKGAYNLVSPHLTGGDEVSAVKAMSAAAGDRLTDIKNALGSRLPRHLTASEAASRVGRAEFSALGEAGRKINPSSYDDIAQGAAQANKGLIRKHITGSEHDLKDALAHRESVSKQQYGEAFEGEPIPIDSELRKLLARPSMKNATEGASKLAREKSERLTVGEPIPAGGVREKLFTPSGKVLGSRGPKREEAIIPAKIPVESLHYIKKGLDDVLSKKTGEDGLAPNVRRAVTDTKKDYLAWLHGKSDPYRVAAESHVENSLPINRMNYGQHLAQKLRTPDEIGENANAYLKARQNQSDTIESALGGPWYKRESEFLNPTQIGALDTVSDRLMRQAADKDLAGKGSSALKGIVSESLDNTGHIPNLLSRPLVLAHYGLDRLRGIAGEKALKVISRAMKTPEEALRLLESNSPQMQEIKKALMERLLTRSSAIAAPHMREGK